MSSWGGGRKGRSLTLPKKYDVINVLALNNQFDMFLFVKMSLLWSYLLSLITLHSVVVNILSSEASEAYHLDGGLCKVIFVSNPTSIEVVLSGVVLEVVTIENKPSFCSGSCDE